MHSLLKSKGAIAHLASLMNTLYSFKYEIQTSKMYFQYSIKYLSTQFCCFAGKNPPVCSHARVIDLFKNTILPKCRFKAYKCSSYLWFRLGKCRSRSRMVYMGYDVSKRARGKYYLLTKSKEPYCYYY